MNCAETLLEPISYFGVLGLIFPFVFQIIKEHIASKQ